jgi:magnesium transporter
MIRSIVFLNDSPARYDNSLPEIQQALKNPQSLVWVSLENPSAEEFHVLSDVFHFHPLTIEDCMSVGYQAPKVDDFGSYIFLIVHALHPDEQITDLQTDEVNIYIGENFLVTVIQEPEMRPISTVFRRVQKDERLATNGSDFLCHAVLDELVDEYMPVIDKMEDEIDWLEDTVIARPNPKILERIINLKHSIMTLRRILSPMREVINRLSRDDFPMIDRQSRIFFWAICLMVAGGMLMFFKRRGWF